MLNKKWYQKSRRRNLVDMHIEDWNEVFLSKLDSQEYVAQLKKAKIQTAMIYANSHVGLCNWPTENGKMHAGLKGKDFLGETIERCHKEGMSVVVYFTLIYDNWAYENNPSWRIINEYGRNSREKSEERMFSGFRYGTCCPNSRGYREYVSNQLQELCDKYKFEGVFLDMTFWPGVCYCPECQARFKNKTGKDLPTIVDWNDEIWLAFQKEREQWLADFAEMSTLSVKMIKPNVTVEHQSATYTHGWKRGVSDGVVKASEYAGGDFYGGLMQQSFVCKLYRNITPNQPFEYMTSRCDPNLNFHTNTKAMEMLKLHNYITLANNGAFLLIDAINPDGTLNEKFYDLTGEILAESMCYEPYLGGELCADVGIYFSIDSKFNRNSNGKEVKEDENSMDYPHLNAAVAASEMLLQKNIPFDVIGKANLENLSAYQIIILPNLEFVSDEEAEALCNFVKNGGSIYCSGNLHHPVLENMSGIKYIGQTKEKFTYMSATNANENILPDDNAPLTINMAQCIVEAQNKAEIIAKITLPYTDPADETIFVSIHSNPPGVETDYPAIIYRDYDMGKVIWSAAPIEATKTESNKNAFISTIKKLTHKGFCFKSNAPAVVEITMFHQSENKCYIVNLVNIQEQFPVIEANDICVLIRLDEKKATKIRLLPSGQSLQFDIVDGYAKFKVPQFEIFSMIEFSYE